METFPLNIFFLNCSDEIIKKITHAAASQCTSGLNFSQGGLTAIPLHPDILFCESVENKDMDCLAKKFPNCRMVLLDREKKFTPNQNFADIWRLPMTAEEIAFRFSRLRQNCLEAMDLKQTREFLRNVLDTSPNLIWFKDQEGRHMLVNTSFCQAVNKTREDITGKKHPYIWEVEDEDPACIASERIVMDTGKIHISEETISTGAGERLLTTYKCPVHDRHGNIWGTMGIGVDVTRERDFQTKLLKNNATLETIFTTMDCGVLCHTLDGNQIISVNRAALEMLGYPSAEDLQKGFHVIAKSVMEGDRENLSRSIESLKSEGDSVSYEYRVIMPDGQLRHVLGNAKIIKKDGQLMCQRLLLDGTAQKLAEEQAKSEQERQHRELVRALSIDYQVVIVFDPASGQGTMLQLRDEPDPALKKIFANMQTISGAFAQYIETSIYPDDRPAFKNVLNHLEQHVEKEKIFYFNYRVVINGDIHYFQLKAVRAGSIENPLGIVIGLQTVNERIREELEQKATLSAALKDARKASEAKSIFLSNMSHDIRTPMNAVVGYTSLALNQLENTGQVRNYLQKILASGKHLLSLINDILDMSHIESGKLQLDEQLCSLPQMLEDLFNIVKPTTDEKNQTLLLDMDGLTHSWIYCDKLRLNQVLLNLLGNSVKYTPENGRIVMRVSEARELSKDRAVYEFRINDNGIGMSEEFLAKIFEPFERAQTSTITGIQGTGLGMTITKNIVSMMNGEISVKSRLNEGTEFRLTVPFRHAVEKDLRQPAQKPQEARKKDSKKNIRILIAEDNEMNQEIAQEFLTEAGYLVDIANNGQEAVEKLSEADENYYQLILMDVQMPVMNGYEATEMIRSLPDRHLANLPIIALTANSFEEDKMEALSRGMTDHVAKPIDFEELFKRIDEILNLE